MKRSHFNRYRTQWTAQFYAAAELTRRGYLVSLTFGNAPRFDLIVVSPNGTPFTVDVKGQSTKNFWLIQPRDKNSDHFFVLIFLPKMPECPRYFILSSDKLMDLREAYREKTMLKRRYSDELGGINWSTAFEYENKWENLPR